MANFKNKILSTLDVVLRVPPVFIVDSLLMNGSGSLITGSKLFRGNLFGQLLKSTPVLSSSLDKAFNSEATEPSTFANGNHSSPSLFDQLFSDHVTESGTNDMVLEQSTSVDQLPSQMVWITYYAYCLAAALIIFTLSTKQLFSFYLWLLSLSLIFWSYFSNESYISYVNSFQNSSINHELYQFKTAPLYKFTGNYFLQVILAILFCFSSSSRPIFISKKVVGAFFIIPTILSLIPGDDLVPSALRANLTDQELADTMYMRVRKILITTSPLLSTATALFYIVINVLDETTHFLTRMYKDIEWGRTIVRHYGIYTLVENQWTRLHVPQVLRVFWLTRLVEQALVMVISGGVKEAGDTLIIPDQTDPTGDFLILTTIFSSFPSQIPSFDSDAFLIGCKELLVRGCETVIAVLGMTSVISSISHEIGSGIQWFLSSEAPEDRGIGTVSAILFFILALQTGITGMEPEKRFQRLYRNICLLFTAILHFIHNIVSPQLFSLSASRNMSISKHARSLIVCFILILLPAYFMVVLWKANPVSTWLLAVSAFSIEVIIKVVISLLIYILFMMDAYRTTMWEPLDDYVYYIKSFGSSIEFIFGIFLFFNGAWILLFESGGTIRALMMCIHAYFNIWMQAKQGWQKFMRRRLAVHKINSLPEASKQQLDEFDDVCAICYQELLSARITRCKHYFHGVCLRKWLYVQDICPLCHETLTADPDASAEPPIGGDNAAPNWDPNNGTAPNVGQSNEPSEDIHNDQSRGRRRFSSQGCPTRDNDDQSQTTLLESRATSSKNSSSNNSFHSASTPTFSFPGHSSSREEDAVNSRIDEEVDEEQSSRDVPDSQSTESANAAFVSRRISRRLVREQGIEISDTESMSAHSNQSSSTVPSSVSTVRFLQHKTK